MDDRVAFTLVLFGPIVLFSGTLVLLDWLGRRQQRRESQGHVR